MLQGIPGERTLADKKTGATVHRDGLKQLLSYAQPAGGARVWSFPEEAGMQVVYEWCAAVDVGKDVIEVAVQLPGDGRRGGTEQHSCSGITPRG